MSSIGRPTMTDTMGDATVSDWLAGRSVAEVADWIRASGSSGYEHPYGFTVVRLSYPVIPRWQLRVHLWPPRGIQRHRLRANRTADQQIHAHGWRIWSIVMIGEIEEETYRLAEDEASELAEYSVVTDYVTNVSRLRLDRDGLAVARVQQTLRSSQTAPYLIPTGSPHLSRSAGKHWSVSLVATETVDAPRSTVIAPRSLGPAVVNDRRASTDMPVLAALLS